ncbi:AraC family transcriptional regulator [Micromonospora sp. NPDC050397]|uniref:helix-turn-helix transcriptional regulator n=1 Tax=Micromonospora sp. NPDC050397 TaxID=3364279 RepID=UPI00384FF59D
MSETTSVLARAAFATRDPEAAYHFMNSHFVSQRQRLGGDRERPFQFRVECVRSGPIIADTFRYSWVSHIQTDPVPCLRTIHVRGGLMEVHAGRHEARLQPGDVCIYPAGSPLRVHWQNVTGDVLRMPYTDLARLAAETTGIDSRDFRLDGMSPISPALARYWRDTIAFVHRQLTAAEPATLNRVILAELSRMLAAAALVVFPNTTMTRAEHHDTGRVPPALLRRAMTFIEAHAAEPITLTEIATVAGATPRALQYAFARRYDTTPLGYLRRVRLERAHQELRAAEPSGAATVAVIAARWGFAHPGRFAALYRRTYGQPPSRTLHG